MRSVQVVTVVPESVATAHPLPILGGHTLSDDSLNSRQLLAALLPAGTMTGDRGTEQWPPSDMLDSCTGFVEFAAQEAPVAAYVAPALPYAAPVSPIFAVQEPSEVDKLANAVDNTRSLQQLDQVAESLSSARAEAGQLPVELQATGAMTGEPTTVSSDSLLQELSPAGHMKRHPEQVVTTTVEPEVVSAVATSQPSVALQSE